MVKYIKMSSEKQIRDFSALAQLFDSDIGVHTDKQMVDAKSTFDLLQLDYSQPVRVVTEDASFMKSIRSWLIENNPS